MSLTQTVAVDSCSMLYLLNRQGLKMYIWLLSIPGSESGLETLAVPEVKICRSCQGVCLRVRTTLVEVWECVSMAEAVAVCLGRLISLDDATSAILLVYLEDGLPVSCSGDRITPHLYISHVKGCKWPCIGRGPSNLILRGRSNHHHGPW